VFRIGKLWGQGVPEHNSLPSLSGAAGISQVSHPGMCPGEGGLRGTPEQCCCVRNAVMGEL